MLVNTYVDHIAYTFENGENISVVDVDNGYMI